MKRLHIVGKSPDNRRLYLARAKGAKFGSFEIPISAKLLKLVREADDARRPKAKRGASEPKASPEPTAEELEAVAATPEPPAAPTVSAVDDDTSVRVIRKGRGRPEREGADDAADRPIEPGDDIPLGPRPGGTARRARAPAPAGAPEPEQKGTGRRGAAGRTTEAPAGAEDAGAGEPARPERPLVQPRTKRPQIPARSKLSPAEIQTLIRAGRTVRSVAQLAGTPTEWVKWLAEPVQQERRAIVANALRERQTRSRLGASAEPLGTSIALNLRSRGVSGAERVVEDGFSAVRSNGREWRVRLSFEQRGRRTSAVWAYDPQRHEVTPLNTLAAQLGWRRPRTAPSSDEANGGATSSRAPARTAAGRTRKSSTTKTASSRGRASSRVSAPRGRSSR